MDRERGAVGGERREARSGRWATRRWEEGVRGGRREGGLGREGKILEFFCARGARRSRKQGKDDGLEEGSEGREEGEPNPLSTPHKM